ncbi:MAG TPA: AI-2E family transporter [Vicinamibacterales bacterium]|jgi:predicted PurR-regulated permease PerM|nr:AI-2E family transporter [Vicinamibacterales bacterium]
METSAARERINGLLFYGTVLLLAYLVYLLFRPFLTPLLWAAVLAALFHAPFLSLAKRWGKTWAAAIGTAAVTVLIIVPLILVMSAFVQEATATLSSIDLSLESAGFARLQRVWTRVQSFGPGGSLGSLEDIVKQGASSIAGFVAGQAGTVLRNVAVIVVHLVVTLFALFFFFRDGDTIMAAFRRVLPFESDQLDRMIGEARDLIHASVTASLSVAIIQGTLGGLMFAILGVGASVFWGVIMTFFALLPIGAGIVWGPVALWLMLSGSMGRGLTLLAVGVGIIGLVDNVLRPMLLSGRTQLNGLLVFVSLLGGIAAFGFLGLVLGPVIMATAIGVLDAYTKERRTVGRKESKLIHGR